METEIMKVSNVRHGAAKPETATPAITMEKDTQGRQVVTDARGRKLALRELGLLEEQDLFMSMGAEASSIPMVLGRALLAARVATIDGEHINVPRNNIQYRGMLQEVGKEGLAAVMSASQPDNDNEQGSEIDTVKNS